VIRSARVTAGALAAAGAAAAAWGTAEAVVLRRRTIELPVAALPPELDGLEVLHLSDVHAGFGPGLHLLGRAVEWAGEIRPDLVAVTGDLVARRRGEGPFRELVGALAATARLGAFAVLGNHDHAVGNDPFAQGSPVSGLDGVELLGAERAIVEDRGRRICLVGTDARRYLRSPGEAAIGDVDESADLRVLLCHYPNVLDRLPAGRFQVVLAGHIHAGQICVPLPSGRVGLTNPGARYREGVYAREGTIMHVSPGIGTTFLPMRVLARPEATLLVLRPRP
jgi:predicted MPP superfamily phosphohydrolase